MEHDAIDADPMLVSVNDFSTCTPALLGNIEMM